LQELVRTIFFYMDRAYLLQAKRPSIQELGIIIFRHAVFEDEQLQPKIIDGFCNLITSDRAGRLYGQALSKNAVTLFHDLAVYINIVEPRLLRLAQDYIMDWADNAAKTMTLADYAHLSMDLMDSELNRCKILGLDLSTRRDLETLLEHQLIQRQQNILCKLLQQVLLAWALTSLVNVDGIADLLDQNAVTDLARVYTLLARRGLHEKLKKPFEAWINLTGTDIIFDEKQEDSMVVRLLTMKRQLDNIWIIAFQRNTILGHGLRETFQMFINRTKKTSGTWGTDNSKPGEMIAKYVDLLLRGGSKAIPEALVKKPSTAEVAEEEDENDARDEDEEVNTQLDQVLDLFRFVNGKAVFEAFYKKDLARRLLMGRSASADAERSMLSRLKTECGSNFTQNLEQMFKDVELGREEMVSYKSVLSERRITPPIDLSVNILSASAWPSYPDIPVNVPAEIKREIDRFEEHYKSKHSGRKLDWKHGLAHCQMKANFPKGRKEIVVSSFQAFVLLLFNGVGENEKVSYETLKEETGLGKSSASRTSQ
jgi:cullin 4